MAEVGVERVEPGDRPRRGQGGRPGRPHRRRPPVPERRAARRGRDQEPGGVTTHPDHVAVTAATQAAFGAYVAAAGERAPCFYYWGVPVSGMAGWRWQLGRASGHDLPGKDDPYGGLGTPDDQFTCTVDTSAVAERARAGPVPAPDPGRRSLVPAARPPGQLARGLRPLPVHPRPPRPPARRPARDLASRRRLLQRNQRPRSPSRPRRPTRPRASRPSRRSGPAGSTWLTPARPRTWSWSTPAP